LHGEEEGERHDAERSRTSPSLQRRGHQPRGVQRDHHGEVARPVLHRATAPQRLLVPSRHADLHEPLRCHRDDERRDDDAAT
jgi:hypothetical protein